MLTIENVMVAAPAEGQVVDPMAWFDSPGPLELEIGCGKGGFLLARARANPHLRLLGVEWANKFYKHCADRMVRRGVTNVRVMRADARFLVQDHLTPECLAVLHLYHPDPWPKKRHHKRRLVQPAFTEAVVRSLEPGGCWYIQTDHEDYYAWIREIVDSCPDLEAIPWDGTPHPNDPEYLGTNFEVKYTREGRSIYRIAYAKKSR